MLLMLRLIGLQGEWLHRLKIKVGVEGVGLFLLLVIYKVVTYYQGLVRILISVSNSSLIVLGVTLIMDVLEVGWLMLLPIFINTHLPPKNYIRMLPAQTLAITLPARLHLKTCDPIGNLNPANFCKWFSRQGR